MIYAMIVLIVVISVVIYKSRSRDEAADVPQSGNADTPAGDDAAPVSPPAEMPVVIMQDGVRTEGTLKMTQGLQVYDANGNIILDVTDRLTKYLGELDTGYNDGELSNPDITDGVSVWVFATSYSYNNTVTSGTHVCATPQFTCSAGKIMWTFPEGDVRASLHVMYGVY